MASRSAGSESLYGLFRCLSDNDWEPVGPDAAIGNRIVLYVHGWQPDAYASRKNEGRPLAVGTETFVTPAETYGEHVDTAEGWRQQGYEVLAFCWFPFADEPNPLEAERKIWDVGSVPRWRSGKSSYSTEGSPNCSMGEAFFEACIPVLSRCQCLHLVGHSLGCQMVASFLEQMLAARMKPPQRVTLLDPYFSNFKKNYLKGAWTGERVRKIIEEVADAGAAVEQYRSSKVLDNPWSDSNDELMLTTAYIVMQPDFLKVKGGPEDIKVLGQRHTYAKYAYFRSKTCDPPCETTRSKSVKSGIPIDCGECAGHASASDDRIRAMMGGQFHWVQVGGTYSPDPNTHMYERRRGPSTSSLPVLRKFQKAGA